MKVHLKITEEDIVKTYLSYIDYEKLNKDNFEVIVCLDNEDNFNYIEIKYNDEDEKINNEAE